MMSSATVHAVWFSGTGTTEKTVRRIARRLADKLGSRYAEYSYAQYRPHPAYLPDSVQSA